MRTVIIPSVYNPYNLYFWIQNFKNKWYNSVDRVYIYLEGDLWNHLCLFQEPFKSNFDTVRKACLSICDDPKITIVTDKTTEIRSLPEKWKYTGDSRGKAFVKLLCCCEGDVIFTSHDDFIFLNDDYLQEWFSDIETKTMDYVYFVGTNAISLYSAMSKLYDVSFLKHNVPDWMKDENYFPFGMTSYGLTSTLSLLLESEGDFTDRYYKKGDYIQELDYTAEMDFNIDYFHLTPLKWHSNGYRNVKSPGDGVWADFKNRKQAPYAYLEVDDFCQYNYPYFHVCLGASSFNKLIIDPKNVKTELSTVYSSNASSAKILERFLYFNVGYVNLFPEELVEKYNLRQFHNIVKNNCSIVQKIADEHYKSLGWKFNTFEHFGAAPLQRYI